MASRKPRKRGKSACAPAPHARALWPQRFGALGPRVSARVRAQAFARLDFRPDRPNKPREAALDPLLRHVIGLADVVRLIGEPSPAADKGQENKSPWPDAEAPSWVAVERGKPFVKLRIGFRGAQTVREIRRELGKHDNNVARVEKRETRRLFSFEAFCAATSAVLRALDEAGCTFGPPATPALAHGGASASVTVFLRTLSPAFQIAPSLVR